MKTIYFSGALVLSVLMTSCWGIQTGKPLDKIAPGEWRGMFILDETNKNKVPLLFHVLTDKDNKTVGLSFINGSDSVVSDSIRFWGDTLYVYFNKQQSYMKLIYEVNLVEGWLYDAPNSEAALEFQGQHGHFSRFPDVRRSPIADIAGVWALQVEGTTDSVLTTTLSLKTKGNYVEGSLRLPTNQSIAVEGSIQGNQLYMSGFDGRNVVLLSAIATSAQALQKGTLRINREQRMWMATK